jgi:hypothetical protein
VLYACDGKWWQHHNGVPEFDGLKLSQDVDACTKYLDVHKVEAEQIPVLKLDVPGQIATGGADGGGNSGFQGLNLAVQFGVRRIGLVGFDMRDDLGVHWHGRHPSGLNNPTRRNFMNWRAAFERAAPLLTRLGVQVFNLSPVSTLTCFPFAKIEDVL